MQATFKNYLIGFISSIVLTLIAYFAVSNHLFNGQMLIGVILILALVQLSVQVIFFLHLSASAGQRWNLVFFISTLGIVIILIAGSLWIMSSLTNRMSPEQIQQYLKDQGSF